VNQAIQQKNRIINNIPKPLEQTKVEAKELPKEVPKPPLDGDKKKMTFNNLFGMK